MNITFLRSLFFYSLNKLLGPLLICTCKCTYIHYVYMYKTYTRVSIQMQRNSVVSENASGHIWAKFNHLTQVNELDSANPNLDPIMALWTSTNRRRIKRLEQALQQFVHRCQHRSADGAVLIVVVFLIRPTSYKQHIIQSDSDQEQ